MKLACRTRDNVSPQGKPRVYYTGHPADLPVYSEQIFADILKLQNCAIYCDEEPEAPCGREELRHELGRMQLIVVPVTGRFLSQPNRAREVEIKFAVEHHIPILPLMQEPGLESEFNEKCGDLQLLSRDDRDPTARGYEEKLKGFLSSVLAGDEMAEKVRAAFDAYIFLSYRKKDRKYAQELMKLIHKNEFCRDIAIWYDEFLVPGENFTDAIADAMKKSDLFTMAVTPSLLEPDNYVMVTEYPEAKKEGKIILPVELVDTDKAALQSAFPDIEDCTLAWDTQALTAALLDAVKRLAVREKDSSPEHTFFIGLAYLNGIDVEVDRERGLSLITGAAQAGLPEAMEQLGAIYRSSGDCPEASSWYKRLAVYWNRRYVESGSEEDGLNEAEAWLQYGGSEFQMGPAHWDISIPTGAGRAFNRMQNICERTAGLYGSVRSRELLAMSYLKTGQMFRFDDSLYVGAMHFYGKAIGVVKDLVNSGLIPRGYSSIADSILNEHMNKPADWCLQNLEAVRQAGGPWNAAECCAVLGDCRMIEGRLDEAMDWYQKGIDLEEQVHRNAQEHAPGAGEPEGPAEGRLPKARERLAASYENLGGFCRRTGDLAGARGNYLRALDLRWQLWDEAKTLEARTALFALYRILDKLCQAMGDWDEAKDNSLHGLELGRQLRGDIGLMEEPQARLDGYVALGKACQKAGDLAGAKDCYRQALELQRQISEENGTEWALNKLCAGYWRMSLFCRKTGALEEAEDDSRRWSKLVEQIRKMPDSHLYWCTHWFANNPGT